MFGIKKNHSRQNNIERRGLFKGSQAVLNAIEDGVLALDANGKIDLINPSAQTLTGWSQADAVGLSFESVMKITTAEGRELLPQENPVKKTFANPTSFTSRDYFLRTQGGKILPIFLHVNPIDAQNSGFVVVFRNISKEIAENREQTEFISTASHEMRTPVASIEGYLGLALNPATASIDARAREYLEKAQKNAQHLGRLFQDLLDVSKAEDGRLKSSPEAFDVVEFAREVWSDLKTKADSKNLNYFFTPDGKKSGEKTLAPVFFVYADKGHLREILGNIFDNAIKYTPVGDVEVDVSGDQNQVEISVRDSGVGIPSEDIPHLFQKFYRVDSSATREIGGTGLGLYLSRKLAESMDGSLTVSSEYEKGSVFTLKLPRISRERAEKLMSEAALKNTEVSAVGVSNVQNLMHDATPEGHGVSNSPVEAPQEMVFENINNGLSFETEPITPSQQEFVAHTPSGAQSFGNDFPVSNNRYGAAHQPPQNITQPVANYQPVVQSSYSVTASQLPQNTTQSQPMTAEQYRAWVAAYQAQVARAQAMQQQAVMAQNGPPAQIQQARNIEQNRLMR